MKKLHKFPAPKTTEPVTPVNPVNPVPDPSPLPAPCSMLPTPVEVMPISPISRSKKPNFPTLLDGSDCATAKQLSKLFTDAQLGMRRVIALGLYAWEVKELKLKHGQWGPWLKENCPGLCRPDSATKKPKPSHALEIYMTLTRGVLDKMGYTVEKYLAQFVQIPLAGGICQGGKMLLLPESKAKNLPDNVKTFREQICQIVDGKTQSQLFFQFKQAEEDSTGNLAPKQGRLKGQGGASAEQRAAAQAAEAEIAKLEAETSVKEMIRLIEHCCDDQHLGLVPDDLAARAHEASLILSAYLVPLIQSRNPQASAEAF